MKSALLGGSVLGNPVGGAYLDLQPSESTAVANTAASVVRTLVNVGKVAIAAVLLYGIYRALRGIDSPAPPPPPPPTDILRGKMSWNPDIGPLSSFVFAKTKNREVFGVCLNEWTSIVCEGELLEIPILFIHEIRFEQGAAGIMLIDGSQLVDIRFVTPVLNLCTLAGVQTIELDHPHARILNRDYLDDRTLKQLYSWYEGDRKSLYGDKPISTEWPTAKAGTGLLRGALPTEMQRIQNVLLQFLETEKDSVTETMGVDAYSTYLNAARCKKPATLPSRPEKRRSAYELPPFERLAGNLEVVIRGADSFAKDGTRFTLGVSSLDRVEPGQLLFMHGELDFNAVMKRGAAIEIGNPGMGREGASSLLLPRQEILNKGQLILRNGRIVLKIIDGYPCCIYRNGLPASLDSEVMRTGELIFGPDDVIEIGDKYALRWHDYSP